MACPFFDPVAPRGRASDSRFAMLPLGDSWSGVCLANPLVPTAPDEHSLHHLCNFGYARGSCPRFVSEDSPDAVRFALGGDDGGTIRVRWAVERDHRPFAHGVVECDRGTGAPAPGSAPPGVLRLAGAYVASYLRRTAALSQA